MFDVDKDYVRVLERWQAAYRRNPCLRVAPRFHRHIRSAWLRHFLTDPRGFLTFWGPRRAACRLLGRHNLSCWGSGCPHAPRASRDRGLEQ
ncbi:hypothetical protein [Streptomyces lushanensis]|uniref:hypothetical protein n=1 Tax=Streptomyces lushanensis TaxID=1434255 RepID=UPI00083773B2|nr:hypothetical protein [Streptomyces lushanensis]